ncbi:MAG: winged helix-turn-helix transcriptional regulator [Treponema sp.]|nr:winged helix-turn-helix transcriptional regulator [Treponema sp.]
MLHIRNLDDGLEIFKTLGSEIRIAIIKLLLENNEISMNEIAFRLGITGGALTNHIKKLVDSGLVRIAMNQGSHGNRKRYCVTAEKILVEIGSKTEEDTYTTEIPVGRYSVCEAFPTCGLATSKMLIGKVDDPRCFSYSEHIDAQILWFTKGYVEYFLPNQLPDGTKIDQITISFEISSEAPGMNNDWPSDISFFLNDMKIGMWTSPGDYGDIRGIFTPEWWFQNWNQYGLLKMLVINRKGTFIDGMKISDVSIGQFSLNYKSTLKFKFQVEDSAKNVGGITLFGSGFGNYNQDIKVRISYSPIEL